MAQVKVSKVKREATLVANAKDCPIGPVVFLGYKDKSETTGVWMRIQLPDHQVVIVESGNLAALHNDKLALIFVDETIEDDCMAELRSDVEMGVKDGKLCFHEVKDGKLSFHEVAA